MGPSRQLCLSSLETAFMEKRAKEAFSKPPQVSVRSPYVGWFRVPLQFRIDSIVCSRALGLVRISADIDAVTADDGIECKSHQQARPRSQRGKEEPSKTFLSMEKFPSIQVIVSG
ncbi:hypothetical protein A9K55_004891 [Cordyceps militaris]|uniref:Uncharacterized protein n=1 Tax=Cordyceps militaris TaxID=73501 RepID=A0A2H4SPT3_CORMI|nr:hypothetical protein A9K55_004891 [Cordyceps militaris]